MALINGKLSQRAAAAIAGSMKIDDKLIFVKSLYVKLLNREPDAEELRLCVAFLEKNPPESLVKVLFNHADFTTIR